EDFAHARGDTFDDLADVELLRDGDLLLPEVFRLLVILGQQQRSARFAIDAEQCTVLARADADSVREAERYTEQRPALHGATELEEAETNLCVEDGYGRSVGTEVLGGLQAVRPARAEVASSGNIRSTFFENLGADLVQSFRHSVQNGRSFCLHRRSEFFADVAIVEPDLDGRHH